MWSFKASSADHCQALASIYRQLISHLANYRLALTHVCGSWQPNVREAYAGTTRSCSSCYLVIQQARLGSSLWYPTVVSGFQTAASKNILMCKHFSSLCLHFMDNAPQPKQTLTPVPESKNGDRFYVLLEGSTISYERA